MSQKELVVPSLPESVADATVIKWYKKRGETLVRDEVVVDIETDKIVLEIPIPEAGVLEEIIAPEGVVVKAGQLLARFTPMTQESAKRVQSEKTVLQNNASTASSDVKLVNQEETGNKNCEFFWYDNPYSPSERRYFSSSGIVPDHCSITKNIIKESLPIKEGNRTEKRVPMTRLRQRIAERLLEASNNTAMLTTFNEVNMKPIIELRKQYGESFEKRHGVRLGLMPFYLKAVVEALKRYPEINASIDGDDIVYHNYFDVSIAVATPKGLVTPVLHDVDLKSMADLERNIQDYRQKAETGKLTTTDLTGGTFTVTNGGVFGSLMSTPIINPPQSAILGLHAISDRPMAVNGEVVILPMMYLALSYDHRIVDGKEAILFLVTIKEMLEDPTRLLLDV